MNASDQIRNADALMRAGRAEDAKRAYMAAWPASKELDARQRVWLLISIAYASVRTRDFDEAFKACAAAQNNYAHSTRIIAGNPLFHLLAGIAAAELNQAAIAEDNLARALVCGGPAIFEGEDAKYLEAGRSKMLPPIEMGGTWDGYRGGSLAQLNSVSEFVGDGYLVEVLTQRLGTPPPYRKPLSSADCEGACGDPVERPGTWGTGRIHFVTRSADAVDVLRFYADLDDLEAPTDSVRLDYEILDSSLDDAEARDLILHAYFVRFARNCYRDTIQRFDMGPLGSSERRTIDYPKTRSGGAT